MASKAFSIFDLFLVPIYLVFFYVIAYLIVHLKYKNTPLAKHFYWGLTMKFIGCFGFMAVYGLYYGYGDTFRYYFNSLTMMNLFYQSPIEFFQTFFKDVILYGSESGQKLAQLSHTNPKWMFDTFTDASGFTTTKIGALFGLMGFHSYPVINLFFAFSSFIGVWCLYRTVVYMFPSSISIATIPVLYFPSVFFWGSSLMKDSIVLGFLGLFVFAIYKVFIKRRRILIYGLLFLIALKVLLSTKEYVIISFAPAIIIWVFLSITNNAPVIVKKILQPLLLILAIGATFALLPYTGKISEKYAIENVLATAEMTANYIYRISVEDNSSAYSLGNVEYTTAGLVQVFPKAVNVTLFRPYLWEAKNPVMLISALESTIIFLISIFVVLRLNLFRYFSYLSNHPFLFASFVFAIIFAFAVGVSTLNFGSLVRYKLPCISFYGIAILIPYHLFQQKKLEKKITTLK